MGNKSEGISPPPCPTSTDSTPKTSPTIAPRQAPNAAEYAPLVRSGRTLIRRVYQETPLSQLAEEEREAIPETRESLLLGSRAGEIFVEGFTPKQREIAALLLEGRSHSEICATLGLSRLGLRQALRRMRAHFRQGKIQVRRSEIVELYPLRLPQAALLSPRPGSVLVVGCLSLQIGVVNSCRLRAETSGLAAYRPG